MLENDKIRQGHQATNLTYNQMFKLSVKVIKDNEKFERSVNDFKECIYFLENRNKILGEEIADIINHL